MVSKTETMYSDLREWIRIVDGMGRLKTVEECTWQEDIGTIAELVVHSKASPTMIYDSIRGYEKGYRVMTNTLGGHDRVALTMRLPQGLSRKELIQKVADKISRVQYIDPEYTDSGPILENVHEGAEVNVLEFPVPKWHRLDGGRYIGTADYVATRDPETGSLNLGTYRSMVQDERHVFIHIAPGKHGRLHRDKYFVKKEPCPAVLTIGGDPLLFMAGASELPLGISGFEWAGGIRGSAFKITKGKYTGLPIAADAELAIEGFIHQDEVAKEGPFGEWHGYYASGARPEPLMEVKAVYHRNSPILTGSPPTKPPSDVTFCHSCVRSQLMKEYLEKVGVPDVVGVWYHQPGGSRFFVAIAIKQQYAGHATQAAYSASQCRVGAFLGRYIVVVDEDIDVTDLEEVVWAICTRSDPATSIHFIERAWSAALDPRISPEDKEKGRLFNSRAIIDATKPFEWKDKFPPMSAMDPEERQAALRKWGFLIEE